jgi:type VI secretion system protein ImpL
MKSLLFALFLYVCLVWVGALYWYEGPQVTKFGFFWTAAGLIAVLVFLAGSHLWGWWRLWRARAGVRPAAVAARPAPAVHEDDAALTVLIAEANASLAKAPGYVGKRGKTPLSGLPLYLLIGPEGSGKTSTFLNSGIEPVLLAGQVTGAGQTVPTRLCNLWLARNAIFAEIGGRVYSGDLARWTQLLRVLHGAAPLPLWRRLWGDSERGLELRGAIGFCDAKEFTSPSNPERMERYSRHWQERLRAVAEAFGMDFPVYQVIAKGDAIPFFSDYFRRISESDAGQVLGCTLPIDLGRSHEATVETESKRLTRSFNPLYFALAKRRVTQLAHEPDPARRPGIYEFPREFKRIRAPLVQFLSEVFRANPLQPGPQLRGYYVTGRREIEVVGADTGDSQDYSRGANIPTDATQLLRGDATQIFRPGNFTPGPAVGARGVLAARWMFASELFRNVVLADTPQRKARPADARLDLYRRVAFGAACTVCAMLCVAFLWSWGGNNRLLAEVRRAGNSDILKTGKLDSLGQLQSLEALRAQVVRLTRYDRSGPPMSLRWGLYSGRGKFLADARNAYFQRFQHLLLSGWNGAMARRLGGANDSYDQTYRLLKTHLMIAGSCPAEPPLASRVLKETSHEISTDAGPEWHALANRQIDFYSSELAYDNPCRLPEDIAARDRAREHLAKIKGVQQVYVGILAGAEKTLIRQPRLVELAPNYMQVLSGPGELSSAFTEDGWKYVEKASKERNAGSLGESCVTGGFGSAVPTVQDAVMQREIQRLYVRDYVDQWRKFLAGFSVVRYNNADDAARKLDILAGNRSPLLGLFALTANQTNFPASPAESEVIGRVKQLLPGLKKAETAANKAIDLADPSDGLSRPADITRSFQPVHWVVPPGSDTWVGEKNGAYIDSLQQLRHSMQDIAHGTGNPPDAAVHQAAGQNYEKALDSVRQVAKGFKAMGVEGLDREVQRLLEEPILRTKGFIISDMDKNAAGKINGDLRILCSHLSKVLRKYPFQPLSKEDSSLAEVAAEFAPVNGEIWKFQAKSLGELTVKEGSLWKAKDPAKKPQLTQDLLDFLNRAQSITSAFYSASGAQIGFNYTLRPRLDSSFQSSILELEVDGQLHPWTTRLQKQFTWPAAAGATPGAIARIKGSFAYPFENRSGSWGIFRMMGDAEPRQPMTKLVEWKYSRVGDGRPDPIQPAPVQLDIVEFPGGVDIFNPKFFQDFHCPPTAVQ